MTNTNWTQIGSSPPQTVEGTMTVTDIDMRIYMTPQQRIEKLEAELAALKAELAATKKLKMWKPDHKNQYYHPHTDGLVTYDCYGAGVDAARQEVGNCFPTHELAEYYTKRRAARQRLEMLALAENGMVPYEFKYKTVNYNLYSDGDEIKIGSHYICAESVQFFPTKEATQRVLDAMTDEDLITLFGTANRGEK